MCSGGRHLTLLDMVSYQFASYGTFRVAEREKVNAVMVGLMVERQSPIIVNDVRK